jgi:hypothetical protein
MKILFSYTTQFLPFILSLSQIMKRDGPEPSAPGSRQITGGQGRDRCGAPSRTVPRPGPGDGDHAENLVRRLFPKL